VPYKTKQTVKENANKKKVTKQKNLFQNTCVLPTVKVRSDRSSPPVTTKPHRADTEDPLITEKLEEGRITGGAFKQLCGSH
jgi:hypothetical protein